MQLLTPSQLASARIAELGRDIAAHLAAAANAANRQASAALSLPDEGLTEWLRSLGAEAEQVFGAHAALGAALNSAQETAAAVLSASGVPTAPVAVDIRSVAEKLADSRREIVLTGDGPAVVTHPPEPSPEPEPEPPEPDNQTNDH